MLITLSNVTLIDGSGRAPVADALVAIRNGKIAYAGPQEKWEALAAERAVRLDLKGSHVLPGLIDTHVHLAGSGEMDSRISGPDGTVALNILDNAQKNLAAGITTVRDLGGWNELEFAVRRAIQRGQFAGPRLVLAGRFISITESGADYYEGMYRVADGVNEVRKAVREQIKSGADLIKLGVTGAVLVEDGIPGATHFNVDEIRAAVEEAAKFNLRVAAHAHGADGIRKAVEAGVHSIEHGTYLHHDRELIPLLAQHGVFLVPTLKVGWDLLIGDVSGVPEWILQKNRDTQDDAVLSLKLAYQAGVPIAMGSDVGTPLNFHGENALEVYWMQQAGMSAMDALVSTTGAAARALGRDSWLGTLEPGKVADILVLVQDPLADLKSLADKKNIQLVFKDGLVAARQPGLDVPQEILASHCLKVA